MFQLLLIIKRCASGCLALQTEHILLQAMSHGEMLKQQTLLSFFTKLINNGYIYTHK